jgi:hypothetical protein
MAKNPIISVKTIFTPLRFIWKPSHIKRIAGAGASVNYFTRMAMSASLKI